MNAELFDKYVAYKKELSASDRRRLAIRALQSGRYVGQELIGRVPVEVALTAKEREIFDEEVAKPAAVHSAPHEEFVAVTKLTRLCNLRCTYCHSWEEGPGQIMVWRTMVQTVRNVLSMEGLHRAQFVWHGGEVTLLKPKFMKKLIWLQQNLKRPGQSVANSLQTNATRLTDEWIDFLIGLDTNVGVSIDGPPEINDVRRVDKNNCGTSQSIIAGIQKLRDAGIPSGALVVVDQSIMAFGARRLLDFALDAGIESVTLLNVLPENTAPTGDSVNNYLPYSEYVGFLCDVFDAWWPEHINEVNFTDLSELMHGLDGSRRPVSCLWSGNCQGRFMTIESNGSLAPCDKYRGDHGAIIGNVKLKPIGDLIADSAYLKDAKAAQQNAVQEMSNCRYFSICRGGCPHDRLLSSRYLPSFDHSCCGLNKLFERMEKAAKQHPLDSHHVVASSLATA